MSSCQKFFISSVFATSLLLMTSSSVSAAAVSVACDGNNDRDKILAVLQDNNTITLSGTCVLDAHILLDGKSNLAIQGPATVATTPDFDIDAGHYLFGTNNSHDITFSSLTLDATGLAILGLSLETSTGVALDGVTVHSDGTEFANIVVNGSEVVANNLNLYGTEYGINLSVAQGAVSFDWVSGHSDASITAAYFSDGTSETDYASSTFSVNGQVLTEGNGLTNGATNEEIHNLIKSSFGVTKNASPASSGATPVYAIYNLEPQDCPDSAPTGLTDLFQINRTATSATLYFTPAPGASGYHVVFGLKAGEETYGYLNASINDNDGVQSITVNHLDPKQNYSFQIIPIRGCASGERSNWLSVKKSGNFYRH